MSMEKTATTIGAVAEVINSTVLSPSQVMILAHVIPAAKSRNSIRKACGTSAGIEDLLMRKLLSEQSCGGGNIKLAASEEGREFIAEIGRRLKAALTQN
jgi:hypothetical protein